MFVSLFLSGNSRFCGSCLSMCVCVCVSLSIIRSHILRINLFIFTICLRFWSLAKDLYVKWNESWRLVHSMHKVLVIKTKEKFFDPAGYSWTTQFAMHLKVVVLLCLELLVVINCKVKKKCTYKSVCGSCFPKWKQK